jgi:hypothetical protein
MYFWKTEKLTTELKADALTEHAKKNYYIGTSAITLIGIYLAIISGTTNVSMTLLEGLLVLTVTVLGINLTFKTNQGKDYITRMVVLSFPLFIKIYTAAIVAGLIIGVLTAMNTSPIEPFTPLLTLSIGVGVQLIYFWRLNTHLSRINS